MLVDKKKLKWRLIILNQLLANFKLVKYEGEIIKILDFGAIVDLEWQRRNDSCFRA